MNVTSQVDDQFDRKETCNVVVVYEDTASRQRAMAACDFLMQELWSEVEFDFHWWRADFLEQAAMAQAAAEQAANADFLIVCSDPEKTISIALKRWFESWIEARHGRDGALLDLTPTNTTTTGTTQTMETFLRGVARRAMLDYFATTSQTITGTLPSSYEEVQRRASQVSSVLDEILHQPPRPPSFGLND